MIDFFDIQMTPAIEIRITSNRIGDPRRIPGFKGSSEMKISYEAGRLGSRED